MHIAQKCELPSLHQLSGNSTVTQPYTSVRCSQALRGTLSHHAPVQGGKVRWVCMNQISPAII
jgi:hypothetical protein